MTRRALRGPQSGEELRQLPLLASLSAGERDALFATLSVLTLRARGALNYAQSIGDRAAFVWSGGVRVDALTPSGAPFTLGAVRAGNPFGVGYQLLGTKPTELMRITALEPSVVVTMPGEMIYRHIKTNSVFCDEILRHCAFQAAWALSRVYELAALGVRERLQVELLRMAHASEDEPWTINPAPKHSMLAAQIGAAREAVSRHLKDLEKEGIVVVVDGELRIAQPERLQRLARTLNGNHILSFPPDRANDV